MRFFAPGLAILAVFGVAACSPTADYEGNSNRLISTSSVTLVQFSDNGVGGITRDTPYSSKAIEAALPGFTTDGIQSANEDTTEWATAVFNTDGFQVLQVFKGKDGKIRTVHGVTHHLQGPNGERIGMTFADIGSAASDCRVGRNLWRGMAICKSEGHPSVELVYAIPGYQGPFDRLPPSKELFDAQLQRIVWTPNA